MTKKISYLEYQRKHFFDNMKDMIKGGIVLFFIMAPLGVVLYISGRQLVNPLIGIILFFGWFIYVGSWIDYWWRNEK